jgi:elongation factor Ts
MSDIEKVKQLRETTLSPINKCQLALKQANGDIGEAIKLLVAAKQADTNDMANRTADARVVYSYVHNNRVGAMIVLASQTDFVSKNEIFLGLAKDICMHIVSTPIAPEHIDKNDVPPVRIEMLHNDTIRDPKVKQKPIAVQRKILEGKLAKFYNEVCLLNQKFVKDDAKTVGELINGVASTLGEKIEVKRFVKVTAQ